MLICLFFNWWLFFFQVFHGVFKNDSEEMLQPHVILGMTKEIADIAKCIH